MGQAIPLRNDYTADQLRRRAGLARQTKDVAQARRLLAIAAGLDGASGAEAARIGGMDRPTLRDWVIRFNAHGPEGLINNPSPGVPPKLEAEHRAFLSRVVEEGPIPAVHGVVRWRAAAGGIWHLGLGRHGLPCPEGLGLCPFERPAEGLSAGSRSHGGVQKNFPARVAEVRQQLTSGTPVEVWFQDEMRVGQKNKLTYRWARKGSRPRATHDQRTQSTYLFGAVCPEHGTGAALVLPVCNSEAMQLHLDVIAGKVSPGAHAIVILDQAGWHGAKDLRVPTNLSLLPLPPRSPELNGQENVWQFVRQNWLSNRVFQCFDDIVGHCCDAWNALINQPWKIMSLAGRSWARVGQSV